MALRKGRGDSKRSPNEQGAIAKGQKITSKEGTGLLGKEGPEKRRKSLGKWDTMGESISSWNEGGGLQKRK